MPEPAVAHAYGSAVAVGNQPHRGVVCVFDVAFDDDDRSVLATQREPVARRDDPESARPAWSILSGDTSPRTRGSLRNDNASSRLRCAHPWRAGVLLRVN